MPRTPRMGWPYPAEDKHGWYEDFKALILAVDASVYPQREDRSFVLFGGGAVSFVASTGVLTWSDPLQAVSAATGFRWYVPEQGAGSSATLQDGEFLFVELVRAPQSLQALEAQVGSFVPPNDNAIVLAQRLGDAVIFRNGAVVSDGQTLYLFGVQAFSQTERVAGVAGLQVTSSTSYITVGGFRFDPSTYFAGNTDLVRSITLRAMLATSNVSHTASAQLYNLTAAAAVTGSEVTTVSASPVVLESSVLAVPSPLPNSSQDFAVQLKISNGASEARLYQAELVVSWG